MVSTGLLNSLLLAAVEILFHTSFSLGMHGVAWPIIAPIPSVGIMVDLKPGADLLEFCRIHVDSGFHILAAAVHRDIALLRAHLNEICPCSVFEYFC